MEHMDLEIAGTFKHLAFTSL